MHADLELVRTALDAAVIGQRDAKTALLLGWLARVHVRLEGAPGCGKSALVQALALASGERSASLGPADALALGSVLRRERAAGGERVRLVRAPLELAPLLCIEDLQQLPGDLASRVSAALARDEGPLVLATCAPCDPEALEPATCGLLERFPLRVHVRGLLAVWSETDVRALLERSSVSERGVPALAQGCAQALRAHAETLPIDASVLEDASRWLAAHRIVGLARALPRLLRAHALLRGADRVEDDDWLALARTLAPGAPTDATHEASGSDSVAPLAAPGTSDAATEGAGAGARADASAPAPAHDRALASGAAGTASAPSEPTSVESLVRALRGRFGRGRGERRPDPAGAPRRRRPLRDFSESLEADPAELWAYLDAQSAERPAVLERERRGASPALVILRDISASMQGPGARWSLRLVRALVEAARAERLRVGYVEFHHAAERYAWRDRFVHRAYPALLARAAQARCTGRTSYQAALQAALDARAPRAACDVVLISDGVPVLGDPALRLERARARRLGWKLHTVFVGLPPVPPLLVELARETGGLAFCIAPRPASGAGERASFGVQPLARQSR